VDVGRFAQSTASERHVIDHLTRADSTFVPPLSSRVAIDLYARKLRRNATLYEAWENGTLTGLVAVYGPDNAGASFISSVSVLPEAQGDGLGSRLLSWALAKQGELGTKEIALEVTTHNAHARRFYRHLGFSETAATGNSMTMSRRLNPPHQEGSNVNRDHNQEFEDNEDRKYSYGFDHIVREYLLDRFDGYIDPTGLSLELGAYRGDMTEQLLQRVADLHVIEASNRLAEAIEFRFPEHVTVTCGLIEEVTPAQKYRNVFLIHTLEHLDAPVEALRRVGSWLAPDGLLFVAVPNANALSRQIAVRMGLIDYNAAVTPGEREHGHRRTYAHDTLLAHLKAASLELVDSGGVVVKPLANFQWDKALQSGIVDRAYLDACDSLAHQMPELSATIYAICRASHSE